MTTGLALAKKIIPAAATDSTNIAFVANRKGLAVAIQNVKGPSAVKLINLPHLPGAALVPKDLFGISVEELDQVVRKSTRAEPANLLSHAFWLMESIASIAQPPTQEAQASRVEQIFRLEAQSLQLGLVDALKDERNDGDISGILSYLTDRYWHTYGKRQAWSLRNVLPNNALKERYGAIILSEIGTAFKGHALSSEDSVMLEHYMYDVLREHSTPEAKHVWILGLTGPDAVPAINYFEVDGYIGNHLRIEHEPWMPMVLRHPTGFILTLSPSLPRGEYKYPSSDEMAVLKQRFLAALEQGDNQKLLRIVDADTLSQVAANSYRQRTNHFEYHDGETCGFEAASPGHLSEIADFLARSLSGPGAVTDRGQPPVECMVLGSD